MDDMTQTPPSKVHTWMLILLTWIAVFSIVIVGILLTRNSSNGLSSSEMAAACQNGTINGITTNLTRISEACNAEPVTASANTTKGIPFSGNDYLPSLTLPINWTGSGFENNAKDPVRPRATFAGTTGIYMNCNECGGVGFPSQFSMAGDVIANLGIVETAVAPRYPLGSTDESTIKANLAKITGVSNVTVTSTAKGTGTLVTVKGSFDPGGIDAYSGPFTLLQYRTQTNVVELLRQSNVTDSEWETMLSSINWASVK
ncbi:MAG: hypothetical protein AAB473_04705 [Patescibacteria group bacterium]